ncbi:MAG: hypothetical protein V1749_07215 [Candidatus Desantisbacteria bacterium]
MKVKPVLDNWELKGLRQIEINENRVLVEHKIPGLDGSFFQNLGTRPGRIFLSGSIQGDEIREDFLEEIRKKFNAATPVSFIADITTATDIKEVIIENLSFIDTADNPDTICYQISLQEFTPPPPDEGSLLSGLEDGLDLEANLEVQSLLEDIQAENTLAGLGLNADAIGSFMENIDSSTLNGVLEGLSDEGLGVLKDTLSGLGLDALKELAKSLGLGVGYEKVEDVFEDLIGVVQEMLSGGAGYASSMDATFAKIIAKLLLTIIGGGGSEWGDLANSFKDNLSKL